MTTALIIAAFLLAAATCWWYRKLWRASVKLNAELLERIADQDKTIAGARVVNNLLIAQVNGKDDITLDDSWPEFIEEKVS